MTQAVGRVERSAAERPAPCVQLTVNLLGSPMVIAAGGPLNLSPGPTMLVAYLALAPRGGRPRARAVSDLFGDCPEPMARRRLNTAMWRLRSELGASIGTDPVSRLAPHRLALSPHVEVSIDATIFDDLVRPVLARPPQAMTPNDAAQLERALSLRRGQLLEPCDDTWVMSDRLRIENLFLTSLDYLVQYHGNRGELDAVERHATQALALEPLREDLHRHLMSAYAVAGRPDLVERQFERCRTILVAELGADPMPETTALYSRLTRGQTGSSPTITALVGELERARREVARLAQIVDRALDHLHRMQ